MFFAFANLFSGIGAYLIQERADENRSQKLISVFKLMKLYVTNQIYRRAALWVMISCFAALGLRATVAMMMIKKGMRREHIVMLSACNSIFNVMNNYVLKRFMVPGRIIRTCSIFLMIYLSVIYIDWFNIVTFDKDVNYNRSLILYFIGIFFEGACPWMSYHIGFINSTTYKKYAATYATTLMGVVNLGKIIPVSITITMLDYVNYSVLFFTLNGLNMLFILYSFNRSAKEIDETPINVYNDAIKEIDTD